MAAQSKGKKSGAAKPRSGGIANVDTHGAMWSVHHALAREPRARGKTTAERIRLLEEERAVKDLLVRYTYFYDGADLDGVMSVFHDDCVLINPRGTYAGKDAIRRNYAFLISLSRVVLHFAPNVLVRFTKSGKEAWMTAYYYGIAATPEHKLLATGGTYADHLVKVKGDWKIDHRRITYNLRNTLDPDPPGAFPGAPAPTRKQSSRDIVGSDFEM